MRLLLDTHLILWALDDSPRLPPQVRYLIEDATNELFYSVASAWEVQIKHMNAPLKMLIDGDTLMSRCDEGGLIQLPVAGRHVGTLKSLARNPEAKPHKDPFDRMLIAQAKADGLLLLTRDSLLSGYNEPCVLVV